MNAAKDPRIGDFGYGVGKTRIGTSTRTYLGVDAEGNVLSKSGSQDEGGGATVCGMRRRILGMRSSAGQRVQQWPPICIGGFRTCPTSATNLLVGSRRIGARFMGQVARRRS